MKLNDFEPIEECVNPDSFGEICVHCNQCGRFDKEESEEIGMRKPTVVVSPTAIEAVYEWKAFLSKHSRIIKKANRTNLCIELINGDKIYFKAEGRSALLGLHANIISIDDFKL